MIKSDFKKLRPSALNLNFSRVKEIPGLETCPHTDRGLDSVDVNLRDPKARSMLQMNSPIQVKQLNYQRFN